MEKTELVEQIHASLPQKGTEYWYLFYSMSTHEVEIRKTTWENFMNDFFRMLKGDIYLTEEDAEDACRQMNDQLDIMCGLRGYERSNLERNRKYKKSKHIIDEDDD